MHYTITTKTADVANAGTDSDVVVILYGGLGQTNWIFLDKDGDDFERGHTDAFEVDAADVGNLFAVQVFHHNTGQVGSRPGWKLEWISVATDSWSQKIDVNKWLAIDEPDLNYNTCVMSFIQPPGFGAPILFPCKAPYPGEVPFPPPDQPDPPPPAQTPMPHSEHGGMYLVVPDGVQAEPKHFAMTQQPSLSDLAKLREYAAKGYVARVPPKVKAIKASGTQHASDH